MEKKRNSRPLIAHLSMFGACAIWGLMAPLGKDAMTHGLDGLTMVSMRVAGGMFLFWVTSLLMRLFKSRTPNTNNLSPVKEHVPVRDRLMFCGAALFGLVFNQCCYTIGLSLTSPINASIVTTSMPIFAMILAALAVILVFVGVWQVTKSKSRRDMEREAKRDASSKVREASF